VPQESCFWPDVECCCLVCGRGCSLWHVLAVTVYLFLPHDTWHIACDVALTRCVALAAECMAGMSFLARRVPAWRGDCSVLRSYRVPCRCPVAWVVCTRCSSILRPSLFGTLFRTRFPQVWCPSLCRVAPFLTGAGSVLPPLHPVLYSWAQTGAPAPPVVL
jgi:hypothetical protein